MPLLHLPEDTLELVTSFLNNNMLNNFGKTCKVIHKLLQECTTRRSICKQPLGHCIECNKHSFNMSLIHCTILTEESNIIIYQTEDGETRIETRIQDETVWLTIDQMSELFQKSRSTINEHILNIYKEGELQKEDTVRKIGNSDFSTKPTNYYNLDVIISVGYRVKSHRGTQFRQWATARLREYLIKGFTMNDQLLKEAGERLDRTFR